MGKQSQEWYKQADYDMATAEYLLDGGRCLYAVFMCHLSVEKALKGLYLETLGIVPPKTHDLLFLVEKIGLAPEREMRDWIRSANEASVATRYPEDLSRIQRSFSRARTRRIIEGGKGVLEWLRTRRSAR